MFDRIQKLLNELRVDELIVEKRLTSFINIMQDLEKKYGIFVFLFPKYKDICRVYEEDKIYFNDVENRIEILSNILMDVLEYSLVENSDKQKYLAMLEGFSKFLNTKDK